MTERDVRFGLESCYRTLAWLAATQEKRNDLVDRANASRLRTVR
ncbi:tetratricopeptide repeat protein [Nonomuraea sp. B19D2]